MDVNLLKKKLQKLQAKPKKKMDKADYEKIFWTPSVGQHVVRVVPSKLNKSNPFLEAYFYYGIGANVMLSPITFKEPDPIKLFVEELRNTNERENWSLARKLEAKLRIFAPVIVRGEEEKGVRYWQFGKNMYMEFLSMAEDEDIGDYTDISEGRDFTVTTVGPETTGTPYNKSSLRPKTKVTPLSDKPEKVEEWLENQPDPLSVYTRFTFDEIKENLQKWLEPEEEEAEPLSETEGGEDEVKVYNKENKVLPKKSKVEEFKELFEDSKDKPHEVPEDNDDLPF